MIDTKELRIGNWVHCIDPIDDEYAVTVTKIKHGSVVVNHQIAMLNIPIAVDKEDIYPIPIGMLIYYLKLLRVVMKKKRR